MVSVSVLVVPSVTLPKFRLPLSAMVAVGVGATGVSLPQAARNTTANRQADVRSRRMRDEQQGRYHPHCGESRVKSAGEGRGRGKPFPEGKRFPLLPMDRDEIADRHGVVGVLDADGRRVGTNGDDISLA